MRLATLIPALLVMSLLSISALFYVLEMQRSIRAIRHDSIEEMGRLVTHLRNMLDTQLTQDNMQGAELSLSVAAMHPAVRTLILADDNDAVLLANRFVWRGRPAVEVASYDRAIASRVHHHRDQNVGIDAQFIARGFYPVTISVGTLNAGTGGGLSSRVGVLFAEMDFSSRYAAARRDTLNTTIGFAGSTFLITLIITLLLHQRISRRAGDLMRATHKLVAGDYGVRANLRGNDELAELGRAFDAMAESLLRQRVQVDENTHRLKEGQRIAQIGSWELDLVTDHLTWSDEIFRIFGIDQASFDASYEAFLNAVHPDDRAAVNKAYAESLANRTPYEITHRLRMADGRIKWVREHCESVFDATGRPLCSSGTVQDITGRVLAQQESQRTRELLQFIVDASPDWIFAKDVQHRFMMVNKAFAVSQGLTPEQMIGRTDAGSRPQELCAGSPDAGMHGFHEDDRRAFAGELVHNSQDLATFSDGSLHIFDTFKGPLRDSNGHIVGVFSYSRDITERKRAEDQLRAINETLEGRVAERTQALEIAKNDAERANRAKSEFLSRMSHELRTPMNAILGFAQVLEVERLTPEQTDYVHEIHRAGDHLLELINELLDLSRIESGKMAVVLQPVDVRSVVVEAMQITQLIGQSRRINFINRCDAGVRVLADPTRLKQILVNLLSNAAKYNRDGGRILLDCQHLDGDRLRLTVTDTGPGIPPEKQVNLFKPFERLGAEYSNVDGTGIGLALSRQLAELMGGALGLDSAPGEGSTFWIDLPVAPQTGDDAAPVLPDDTAVACIRQIKVLYIEDNAANLRVIEAMFRHQQHLMLLSATNGEYGLELARRYAPDVILLDIHLPGMDGYDVLKVLRAQPETRHIPVIALSADAMPIDIESGLRAGFAQYLTKPVKVAELTGAVEKVLAQQAQSTDV